MVGGLTSWFGKRKIFVNNSFYIKKNKMRGWLVRIVNLLHLCPEPPPKPSTTMLRTGNFVVTVKRVFLMSIASSCRKRLTLPGATPIAYFPFISLAFYFNTRDIFS